jgi:uncharacterized protein YkwD
VRVTDDDGASSTTTRQVHTDSGGGFVEPPMEDYDYIEQGGYTDAQIWLINCYRPLPAWQDADRVFQTATLREWADEIFAQVNVERANQGLPALIFDPHLELVAQAHSRDMALQGFHDHNNVYGMTPFDRLDAVNRPPYSPGENIAGENIAWGFNPPVEDAPTDVMQRWMASPDHQANILNPNVTHIGIGVYYRTDDPQLFEAYFTQVFANWAVDPSTWDWLEPAEVPAP